MTVDLDGTVAEVKDAIAGVDSEEELDALAEAEQEGKGRQGVFDAIDARSEALKSDAEDDAEGGAAEGREGAEGEAGDDAAGDGSEGDDEAAGDLPPHLARNPDGTIVQVNQVWTS